VATGDAEALHALATALGVQREWRAADGSRQVVSDETVLALVRLLGAEVGAIDDAPEALRAYEVARAETLIEPVVVQWGDTELVVDVRAPAGIGALRMTLDAEDGTTTTWSAADGALVVGPAGDPATRRVSLPAPLPYGVHRLHVDVAGAQGDATVLAAPARLEASAPSWGLFAPVYALHDHRSTTGDLGTFDRFAHWAGSYGARVMGTLPLLATFYGAGKEPTDASPYAPVTRRHWNEVYVDLTAVPEVDSTIAVTEPSPGAVVDLPTLASRKRATLEAALANLDHMPARRDAFAAWLAQRPDVVEYARFRAAVEHFGPGAAIDIGDEDPVRRYHEYVQWLAEQQLDTLARNLRDRDQELYLDLPIGAHPDGFDVATEDDLFVTDASVGAPPDEFFDQGQGWGFPPVLPHTARATGHRYLRECIDTHLRAARHLRVDHVIGFHRMWWVPKGASPTEGAYVDYPADEQYAALLIAASRANARVVGENLGTVPPETNRALRDHGLLGIYVVPFELDAERRDALPAPDASTLACLDTHDTATFAAWWRDLAPADRGALLECLRGAGCFDSTYGEVIDPEDVQRALLVHLGGSDAEVVLASLEDLWLEVEAQNVPGTTSDERPNFRRRAARSLDDLEAATTVCETLAQLDRARTTNRKMG
jgi:4-alpha-glucanotransferase